MKRKGLYQAASVAGYCVLVGIFMSNIEKIFANTPKPATPFGPAAFLVMFSMSALICGLLVFYQPYKLFFDNKKKQAADLVLFTTGWLFIFFIIFITLAVVFK